MAIIVTACVDDLVVSDVPAIIGQDPYVYYGSVARATSYFATKLYKQAWLKANADQKLVALVEASRLIDQVPYEGEAIASTGYPAFPRTINSIQQPAVPLVVEWAAYEIALHLLRGADVERQVATLNVTSQGFASRRQTQDVVHVPTYLRAGIPSIIAWNYLLPYVYDTRTIRFSQPSTKDFPH